MSTSFQDAGASTKDSESCLRGLSGFVVSSCIAATSVSFAGLVVPVPAIKWSCEQLAVSSVLQAFLATFGFPALVALVESEFYGQSLIQFPEGQPEKTTGCRKYAPSKHTALAQEAKAVPSTQCASVRSVTAVLVVALAAVFAVECLFMIARAEPSLDSSILVPENSLTAEYRESVALSTAQSSLFTRLSSSQRRLCIVSTVRPIFLDDFGRFPIQRHGEPPGSDGFRQTVAGFTICEGLCGVVAERPGNVVFFPWSRLGIPRVWPLYPWEQVLSVAVGVPQ